MATRIRLQRHGKKGKAFYSIVVADGRAPRNGRFIEKLGTYNPMTDPAMIRLDEERALYWFECGAQPSDTARSILSKEGILLKHHLLIGMKKGALTLEQVDAKMDAWKKEKEAKFNAYIGQKDQKSREKFKKALEAEVKVKETKAGALAKKRQPEAAAPVEEVIEETTEEVVELPVVEEAITPEVIVAEEVIAEVVAETPAVETAEEENKTAE